MVRIVDPAYAAQIRAQAENHLTMWRVEELPYDPCLARLNSTPYICTLPLGHTHPHPHRDQWAAVWWEQ
jgi:hypothetical protein